jgi:SAM-dependent methyltransferase
MKSFFKQLLGRSERESPQAPPLAPRRWDPDASADDFIELCFRIVLGRVPKEFERGEHRRAVEGGLSRDDVQRAVVRSPEFLLRRRDWRVKLPPPAGANPALDELGSDEEFVNHCYRFLLNRRADASGLDHYLTQLGDGFPREWVVRTLSTSREFNDRFGDLTDTGTPPADVQLCELANPAKWDNPEWLDILLSYLVIADHKEAMHRKGYEFTQLIFGLKKLGRLREDVRVLSVGAGHEAPAFWLANHVASVVATDLYAGEWRSIGAREGDARVLARPEDFAPFPYRRERLTFMRMNGCQLGFRDATFDVAYSLSSIEHFGGVAGASQAVCEMARVVKPGGLIAIATDWCVDGPGGEEVFTPEEVRRILDIPGLRLVQPIDDRVWNRYQVDVVDVRSTPLKTPHMLLRQGDNVFTSVMVFLNRIGTLEP